MTAKIVALPSAQKMPDDSAAQMRDMAEAIERGEITEMVIGVVWNGEYHLFKFSSLVNNLVLATLLHDSCVRAFRGE